MSGVALPKLGKCRQAGKRAPASKSTWHRPVKISSHFLGMQIPIPRSRPTQELRGIWDQGLVGVWRSCVVRWGMPHAGFWLVEVLAACSLAKLQPDLQVCQLSFATLPKVQTA